MLALQHVLNDKHSHVQLTSLSNCLSKMACYLEVKMMEVMMIWLENECESMWEVWVCELLAVWFWTPSESDKKHCTIRNTLFCHFPVTMVTDCEMCVSMYVLVPTRTVCQWSIFYFICATTWFKETTTQIFNLWIFSQQDKLGVDWLLSPFTAIESRSYEADAHSFFLSPSLLICHFL